jgi:hypothetical protein
MQAACLEEYKALRAEIVGLFVRADSRLALAWAGVAALVGAAAVSKIPELSLVGWLVVIAAWRDHQVIHESIMRLSAYIQVAIEPLVDGLRWEGINATVSAEMRQADSRLHRLSSATSSSYPMFAVAVMLAALTLLTAQPPVTAMRWAFDALLSVLLTVAMVLLFIRQRALPTRLAKWRDRFEKAVGRPNEINA